MGSDGKKGALVRSSSDELDELKGLRTWSSQHSQDSDANLVKTKLTHVLILYDMTGGVNISILLDDFFFCCSCFSFSLVCNLQIGKMEFQSQVHYLEQKRKLLKQCVNG